MKKIFLALLATVLVLTTSCKKKTEETTPTNKPSTNETTFQISEQGSEVYWTGYKFTEKKGVKGKFKKINITNAPIAKTALEAFNGTAFNIPVSSIFSENEIRDNKLATLFFGFMDNTELLNGNFVTKGEKIFLNLKMNNVTKEIPLTYKIADRHVRLEGALNILEFGAEKAYNSIHKACELLHTGPDGVSKTWDDVAIEAIVYLK